MGLIHTLVVTGRLIYDGTSRRSGVMDNVRPVTIYWHCDRKSTETIAGKDHFGPRTDQADFIMRSD